MVKIKMERVAGDYGFEVSDEAGKTLLTDNSPDGGGIGNGFRPMQLLLAALGSCSAIDIVSILKKQRQTIENFKISITGVREDKEIPALWKQAHMSFYLAGSIQDDKAIKACTLSVEKYCSVAETLRRSGAIISWDLFINDQPIKIS